MSKKNEGGLVLEIQRMSTEDGPGIRTTVFFKGCPLTCAWCHNPESILARPQVQWVGSRCIRCLGCVSVCPEKALTAGDAGIEVDRDACKGCGTCADECPTTAMELMGTRYTVEDLVREVEKDRAYFESSGGGITASGGEPTMQADFVAAFLKACRDRGLSTALDSSGLCTKAALNRLLPYADLVLFDIKETDPDRHRRFTGVPNEGILANCRYVHDLIMAHGTPARMWVRTPLIPGFTAFPETIARIGGWIAENLGPGVARWDLCAFNNLCRDKYTRLGLSWILADEPLLSGRELEELAEAARASGVDPEIVHASGATRMEDVENGEERPERPRLTLIKGGCC
ncbi:MAG: glycyl-radical enzyme activating protein [Proteobacteria bacterium]|nr:glycyl-radical enzyme activating protein [Pseudomonadota bacterium]